MRKIRVRSFLVAFLSFIFLVLAVHVDASASSPKMPAFPDAQGYGKFSQGGRGGAIIYVTTLADNGPGSLRACAEAQGPRNCLFKVGGVIRLDTPIMLGEANSYLSVLGQTAPGSGIVITIDEVNQKKKHTPLILKSAHDVLLRHIRIRPRFPNSVKNVDALTIEDSTQIYVDHVSGSWATDENINTHANSTDVTIANSLFGEGLNKHSKCALLGSDPRRPQNITFWRNACISNRDRNPDDNHYGGSCIDIINNLFFNARSEWGEVFSQYPGGTPISYVGNYFKAGPSTEHVTYAINWNDTLSADGPHIYQRDNETWTPGTKKMVLIAEDTEQFIVAEPPCPLSVDKTVSAKQAYDEIRKYVGAFPRDGVDIRFIDEVSALGQAGQGQMVKAPGELPAMDSGTPYADDDADGIADSVEASVGAQVNKSDPWIDSDRDGWANFDQFMQMLSEDRLAGIYPK